MEDLIIGVTPTIIEEELIIDGLNSNFRPLIKEYITPTCTIHEVFTYMYGVDNPAWNTIASRELIKLD